MSDVDFEKELNQQASTEFSQSNRTGRAAKLASMTDEQLFSNSQRVHAVENQFRAQEKQRSTGYESRTMDSFNTSIDLDTPRGVAHGLRNQSAIRQQEILNHVNSTSPKKFDDVGELSTSIAQCDISDRNYDAVCTLLTA